MPGTDITQGFLRVDGSLKEGKKRGESKMEKEEGGEEQREKSRKEEV